MTIYDHKTDTGRIPPTDTPSQPITRTASQLIIAVVVVVLVAVAGYAGYAEYQRHNIKNSTYTSDRAIPAANRTSNNSPVIYNNMNSAAGAPNSATDTTNANTGNGTGSRNDGSAGSSERPTE